MRKAFSERNPRLVVAMIAALQAGNDAISAHLSAAAEMYLEAEPSRAFSAGSWLAGVFGEQVVDGLRQER